jgi:uncharacterized protein YdbL (DUF1318 family)
MKARNGILTAWAISILFWGCSVRAPELNVTGEKTALENQVLGTFQKIESDTWLIASTRAVGGNTSAQPAGEKKQVLDAVQNRKFNKDDVDELKQSKVIGENNQGYVEVLTQARFQDDAEYRRYVDQIVAEENRDRKIIFERILTLNETAADAGMNKYGQVLAKLNYDNSEPGTMIQEADGRWVEKPKAAK